MTSVLSCLPLYKCAGKSFLYMLNRMVLTSGPGSTLTGIGLLPWLVIIWSVVWNDVCPCDATSVGSLPSWLECVLDIMWLTWWNLGVGLFLYLLVWWGDLHVLEGLWLVLLWQGYLCLLEEWLPCLQLLGLLGGTCWWSCNDCFCVFWVLAESCIMACSMAVDNIPCLSQVSCLKGVCIHISCTGCCV